jgi:outer membrane protein assembly complex protein YaeT
MTLLDVKVHPIAKRTWAIILAGLVLLVASGCASQQAKPPEQAFDTELPEVKQVSFSGNEQFLAFRLRRVMAMRGRPLLQPWQRGELYDSSILQADLLRLRKFYIDRGFLSTSATVAAITEDTASNSVSIVIDIVEGPVTLVESVGINGTWPAGLPAEQDLLAKLPLRPGEPLTKEAFDQSKAKLLEYLENLGYAGADVVPNTRIDEQTHQARVKFRLEPGVRRRFGRVSISGAEQVPEYVIQREITIREGDDYSRKAIVTSRNNVLELGMFRGVTARSLNLDTTDEPVDVDFKLLERKPRSIELGVGISSVESVRFGAEWHHRNLFDEAQSLRLLGWITGINQTLEADLHDPWFFNTDTSVDYKLFALNYKRIRTDPFYIFDIVDPYPGYNLLTSGAEWRLQHDYNRRLSGIAGLELTSNDFYDIELSPEQIILEGAEDNKLFVQFIEAQWNARDSNINPTRGVLLRGKLDHANKALLSDSSFAKLELEGRYYRPLPGRTVFATRLRIGGIEPYGESDTVPSNVRFFAGGPGSVRGYQLNRLGPLDANNNPIGGNSLLEGSVEIRYPIIGQVGGTAFVDFGNVFLPAFSYRLDELKYTVGIGLTYMTPVGPLRAELTYPIEPVDRDLTSNFFFSIGQAF